MAYGTYGKGRTAFYKAYADEAAEEKQRYEDELSAAEGARSRQASSKGLWSSIGSVLGGLALGPVGMFLGGQFGRVLGTARTSGDVAKHRGVSTDVGLYERDRKSDLERTNRMLDQYDEDVMMADFKGIGTSLLTAFTMGGGSLTDASADFTMTEWGSAAKTDALGNITGGKRTSGEIWKDIWGSKKDVTKDFGNIRGPGYTAFD